MTRAPIRHLFLLLSLLAGTAVERAAAVAGDYPCPERPILGLSPRIVGRNTASVTGRARLLAGRTAVVPGEATVASIVLRKGRGARVLLVTATLGYLNPYPPSAETTAVAIWPAIAASVNGLGFDGNPQSTDCGGSGLVPPPASCTVTATWIADLAALERAFPGRIRGKPLCVELGARDFAVDPVPTTVDVTLGVTRLRK